MTLPEIKTRPPERIQIPLQFGRLRDIAYNLWWTWTPQARALFDGMDPVCWARYRNPIELLIDMDPQRWHELADSEDFIRGYRNLVERFDGYMAPDQPTWFDQQDQAAMGPIAYFSTEFGWHESLHVYSGGLGILSGDHGRDTDSRLFGLQGKRGDSSRLKAGCAQPQCGNHSISLRIGPARRLL